MIKNHYHLAVVLLFFFAALQGLASGQRPFEYEITPGDTSSNALLIGNADGGAPFDSHSLDSPVREIQVWVTGNTIQGIRTVHFNDQTFLMGTQKVGSPDVDFSFALGEKIKGDIILTGNGIGTRLGHISFTTSRDQVFSAGDPKTNFFFPSGNSYLMGFFGLAGSDVDSLGLYMMKEIDKETLSVSTYDFPTIGSDPNRVIEGSVSNPTTQSSEETVTFRVTESKTKEWSTTQAVGFTFSSSVQAGVPLIGEVSLGFEFSVGVSGTQTSSEVREESVERTTTITVGPCTSQGYMISYFENTAPLPYTGVLIFNYNDGSMYTINNVKGEYKAVSTSSSKTTLTEATSIPGCGESPVAAPVASPVAAPVASPVAAPVASPVAAPVSSPVAAPVSSPVAVPVASPVAAPFATPVATPVASPAASPVESPVAPPVASPVDSPPPMASPVAAPGGSPAASVAGPFENNNNEAGGDVDITLIYIGGDVVNSPIQVPGEASGGGAASDANSKRSKKSGRVLRFRV